MPRSSRPNLYPRRLALALLGTGVLLGAGCVPVRAPDGAPAGSAGEVVVYTSLDEPYAQPVLEAFTRETGVRARPVYDTEANKSRGLAQRILAEASRPQADVFWSSELLQMLVLRWEGVLAPYRSPAAEAIPARYRDPEGYWTGFAGRLRVFVYYQPRVKEPPRTHAELEAPRWRNEVAMANPLFGTTTTEAAALWTALGPERAGEHYRRMKANGVQIVDGNSVSAERTARGDVLVGLTDTDDAYARIDRGAPLGVVFPDQEGAGTLLIPNTAALVKGAPRPEGGKRFLDYLLRAETELLLAGLPSRQLPLHPGLEERLPEKVRPLARVKAMELDYSRLAEVQPEVDSFLRELFLQ